MEQKERRLYIEKITVEDFKSYKGAHKIGPFGKGFNTIVGPNGSGKSNVIDCILFVLGFKAKKLRHSRAEDLIHSGEPRPSKATVEIELKDESGKSVSVARSVTNKGKSTYSINGETAQQERIFELMKGYNVDLVNNRFMILQGEIESISQMKAKGTGEQIGLVEYLEEIVGTSGYIEEIKRAEEEVGIKSEVAARYRAEYQFSEKEVLYLQPKAQESKSRVHRFIEGAQSRIRTIESTREAHAEEKTKAISTKEEATKAQTALRERKKEAEASIKADEKAKEQAQITCSKKESVYLEIKKESEKILSRNRLCTDQIKKLKIKKDELTTDLARKIEEKKNGERKHREIKEEKEENTKNIQEGKQERARLEKAIEEIEEKKGGALKRDLEKAQEQLVAHMRKGQKEKKELREIVEESEWERREYEKYKKELNTIPEEISRIRKDADAYDAQAHEKNKIKIREIEEIRKETEREIRKREIVLREAVKEAESGRVDDRLREYLQMDGYHGRVRDLGTVSDKYLMAVSAVARGGLHSLVVDTTRTAEACLDVIKAKGLGRHTILVMDKLGPVKESRESNRLVDRVKCKKEYIKCFYHVMGNSLVVDTLDEAMKRAFMRDRPKVVTLKGQVIDKSGLMSSSPVQPAKMTARRTPKEIQEEIDQAGEGVKEAMDGLVKVEEAEKKIKQKIETAEAHRKRKDRAGEEVRILEERLHKVEEAIKRSENRKDQKKDKRKKQLEEQVSGLEKEKKRLEHAVQEKEKRMEAEGGAMYREMKAKALGIEEVLYTLEKRNREIEKILLEPVVRKEEISQIEKEEQEIQDKIERAEKEIETEKEKILTDRLQIAEREMHESKEAAKEETARRIKAMGEMDILRGKEIEIEVHIKEIDIQIADIEQTDKSLIREQDTLIQQIKAVENRLGKYKEEIHCDNTGTVSFNSTHIAAIFTSGNILGDADGYILYRRKESTLHKEMTDLQEKEKEEKEAKDKLSILKEERVNKFLASIRRINQELKRVYSRLTFGGDAEIEAVDYLDPFSEGVIMSVMPPRKSWKSISQLSGGERTLASLSLIFALHEYHPNSFYVMDEIDAALDYKNVGIVGQFIAERAKDCQFLVISLRENMYELGDVFIGVYRPGDTTLTMAVDTKSIPA